MLYTIHYPVPGTTWEAQEAAILENCPILRLHDAFIDKFASHLNNLEKFIHNFLKEYNKIYPTYQNSKNIYGHYYCALGKKRSLIDIFLICRYYFPECTLREVKRSLLNYPTLGTHICSTILRRVYWDNGPVSSATGSNSKDEFGKLLNDLEEVKIDPISVNA